MELNKNINNKSNIISDFSNELTIFLKNNIEGATFTIDKIEGEIAVCENRTTKEIINIHLSKLPENIKETDIIKYTNGKYVLDSQLTNFTKDNIKDKFNRLKKK